MGTAEQLMTFGQGNLEAFVKSGQILASGVQGLTKHVATAVQATLDETVSSVRALSAVKSLKEAMDLQASLARTAMERAIAQTGQMTEATLKLTEEASAPITARVTAAMELVGQRN